MKKKRKYLIPDTGFAPINKFLKTAENYLKASGTSQALQGKFSADVCINGLLRQIEKLGKIDAKVWGPGFAEARETAYEIIWEMVGETQKHQGRYSVEHGEFDGKGVLRPTSSVGSSQDVEKVAAADRRDSDDVSHAKPSLFNYDGNGEGRN